MLACEYTINAALAGHYEVHILMATGDKIACQQIVEQLGEIEYVVVKKGTGRYSAQCLPGNVTQPMIEVCARHSVRKLSLKEALSPLKPDIPIKITVELQSSDMVDRAMLLPGVSREDRKLCFNAEDMPRAYSAFRPFILFSYPR
jgi:D-amino peptidase